MNTKTTQNGRSMIEMLGVLAIIGVLSVGGIAGYSKAMQKYRINKTADQVAQIINGVRTLYSGQKNYTGINGTVLRKAKILPESAFESSSSNNVTNPFGGVLEIYATGRKLHDDNKAVALSLRGIPEDACIELVTQDWGAGEGLYAINVDSPIGFLEGCAGEVRPTILTGCVGGSTVALPIPVDKAIITCSTGGENGEYNNITFYFY
ncbi:MAG: hypothetical protein IJ852_05915 [Alphaproteobacteria bacterium]|nr:hypothetical protein [Alphaproteobacteria bacterium]